MTISLNWLKEYIDIDLPPADISELLTSIGLELEDMQEVETIRGGLEGVVVGEVLETWKHPNADKLTLTKVSLGGEPLQIVCGAPNVAAGQKVLVATVGTTLYPIEGEPIKLQKGKIRGEVSEGMICAEDELGIGHDHAGILVLPDETPVGMTGREYFKLEKDVIFEIGLTPNRSDATCHLGVAQDLAAALKIQHEHTGEVRLPSAELPAAQGNRKVEVIVENPEACPRYAGIVLQNVTVGESPDWLKKRLQSIGQRPISNIVDITNFILHELGQPLHAFDLDEIAGQTVRVKTLPVGAKFISLDEQVRSLSSEDLMICDGNSQPMCIGGVFGGIQSGVKNSTKNIFLESAHFNARWIRRTSTRHGLRTDAARIFEKGSDPNRCVFALKRAAALMCEIAGGEIASEVIDIYPNPIQPAQVTVTYEYVYRLIGQILSPLTIRQILEAMGMEILTETTENFTVAVPTNKADVTRPADVVEEILRIYGLDNVPAPPHLKISMNRSEQPDPHQVRNAVADLLAANGFNEIMSLSLSQSTFYKEILPLEESRLVYVNNTSNVHLDIMRPTMLFSGLEAVLHNQNRQQGDLKLFEYGKTYHHRAVSTESDNRSSLPFSEPQHLAIFIAGQRWSENWRNKEKQPADFFTVKTFVDNVLARLGIGGFQETQVGNGDADSPLGVRGGSAGDDVFAYGMKYHRGAQTLATFGKVQPKILKKMGVRNEVFYADLEWDLLLQMLGKQTITYQELSRFPTVRRDLALVVGSSVKFSDLAALARKAGKKLLKEVNLFDVYEDEERLGAGKKSYALSFTFEDPSRTLQDKEVDAVVSELIAVFEGKLGAAVRR